MKSILTKLVLVVSVIATSQAAIASDFEVDGIGYDIVSAADLTCSLTDGKNADGDIIIPEKVSYKGKELTVISIGEKAFYKSKITSVIIPNSVNKIGDTAFANCSNLVSVSIPNSVTSIDSEAFSACSSLVSVSIPNSVTSIYSSTFNGCSSLVSISIPNSVTSIGVSAFYGCSSLVSISIPNSVTSIESHAFKGCSNLVSVSIPNSLTSIATCTFYGCSSLESIVIPNSVTKIEEYAFWNCSENMRVVIPNTVGIIEQKAFSSIEEITLADGNGIIDICSYSLLGTSYRPFITRQLYVGRDIKLCSSASKMAFKQTPFTDELEKLIIGRETTSFNETFKWDDKACKLKYLEIQKGENELTLDFDIKSEEELEVVINRKITGTTIIRPDILKFGDDLADISSQNFDFSRLKNVTFGKSMSDLPSNCLKGNQITTIYMRNPQPPTYTGSIPQTTYTDATLYVPKGALEAYQTAEPWKTFWDIQEIDMDSGLDDITLNTNKAKPDVCVDGNLIRILNAEDMSVSVYNPDGSQIWQTDSYTGDAIELHPGMHIVRVGNRAIKLAI